jgi:hypothetical protein
LVFHQRLSQRRPHVAGVAETVQHDHRRAFAADADKNGGPVRLDMFDAETGREFLDFGGGGERQGQCHSGEDEPTQEAHVFLPKSALVLIAEV